ncbi:MAG: sensor histidine kinase [Pseudomonadota bacterium]|nr:sensor histidine kinase [Pseudomonadota bacterium]
MAALAERRSGASRIRNVIGVAALMIAVSCVLVGYQWVHTYRQAVADGQEQSVRLADILADHSELTFLGVDLSLRRAIERQYFNSLFGNNLPEYTEQNFKIWLNETPQIVALALIDSEGMVDVAAHKKGYEHWLDYHQTQVGQAFFDRMREADDTTVFVGKVDTQSNGSLILMSRRYNKLNGEFGGIVVAAINPNYFLEFYTSIASGDKRFMALMLPPERDALAADQPAEPVILASGPFDTHADEALSKRWLAESMAAESAPSAGGKATSQIVKSDGAMRIVAVRQLKNMPIAVSVVLDSDDFLYAWRQSSIKDAGFIVLFTIFGSILSYFAVMMARQIVRVEESEGAAILASQAKSEFLANMSHELRTPLNAIIGFSEMINSGYFGPLNARQKERIHDIHLCASHLLQLITDILEFSKGDAGKLELVEETVDMNEIVSESVRIMNGKIKTKGIQMVVAIEPGIPALWGDKRKIRQILINLLSNAVKFTPENGTITVTVRRDQNNSMHMIVADTGIGIAESDIPRALSVFGQVHGGRTNEGTGLGLPLCKMYAELHGGKLLLTSKLDEGTTVRVTFPHQRTLPKKEKEVLGVG